MTELAFDRAGTVRLHDEDGRMFVAKTNISKAVVSPYHGREIPGGSALGLDPDKVYRLYRDPAELTKAAATFNNVPVLSVHKHVTAAAHDKTITVGATGTEAAFDGQYLTNSLAVWDAEAIDGIRSGQQRELSCCYRYDPDMTPGVIDGHAYDGVMRNIRGNHVALVQTGRAGPDVLVADAAMKKEQPMNFTAAQLQAIADGLATAKLAADASPDTIAKALEGLAEPKSAADSDAVAKADAARVQAEADAAKAQELADAAKAETANVKAESVPKAAMDAAIAQAKSETAKEVMAQMRAVSEAQRIVAPHVGEVLGMDSADEIYAHCLKAKGHPVDGITGPALKVMVGMLPDPRQSVPSRVAMDAATADAGDKFSSGLKLTHS